MSFLDPLYLLYGLLAIPILLLHRLKRRRQTMQVSSVVLWQRLLRDEPANRPWQSLRRSLLLILQLLILAALALALARPAFPIPTPAAGPVVVVLDASASMNARTEAAGTRFSAAQRATASLIAALPAGAPVTLILAADPPQVLASAEADRELLQQAVAGSRAGLGTVRWEDVFSLAVGFSAGQDPAGSAGAPAQIFVFSDGGIPGEALAALPPGVRLIQAGSAADNLAVSAFALREGLGGPQLFTRVTNYGQVGAEVVVSFYADDAVFDIQAARLEAGGSREFTHTRLPANGERYEVRLDAPGLEGSPDGFPLDDRAYAVYRPRPENRVLLVTSGSRYLEHLLTNLAGVEAVRLLPDETGRLDLPEREFDAYIFDGVWPDAAPEALAQGSLLLINPPANAPIPAGGGVIPPQAVRAEEHPLMEHVTWEGVQITAAQQLALPDWAEPLVSAPGGPLIYAGAQGGRRTVVVAFDLAASNLPLQVAFPVLFSNLMDYLLGFDALQHSSLTGQPGSALTLGNPLVVEPAIAAGRASWISPSGKVLPYTSPEAGGPAPRVDEPGIYTLQFEQDGSLAARYYAANLFSPAESDLRQTAAGPGSAAGTEPATNWSSSWALSERAWWETWPWLAVLALTLLLIEGGVYLRGRFPAPDADIRSSTASRRERLQAAAVQMRCGLDGAVRSARFLTSLTLRLVILACLVLSLTGIETVRAVDRMAVVFLLDRSDSMRPETRAAAEDFIRRSLEEMPAADLAALVVFGGDALLERPLSTSPDLAPVRAAPRGDQTDFEAAVRLALGIFPGAASRRIVLLSDGVAPRGGAISAARLAAAGGARLITVPFTGDLGPEALVAALDAPQQLFEGEHFDLHIEVQANARISTHLRVLLDGQVVYQGLRELSRGTHSFSLPLAAGEPGFKRLQVQIEPETDHYYQNNSLDAFLEVAGPPQVLLVAAESARPASADLEARALLQALQASGVQVSLTNPEALSTDPADLACLAAVVLVDVPASRFSERQMRALQSFVGDLGGGLVAVGGPSSFGPGGYAQTPLEEILPVRMAPPGGQPPLSVIYLIDRSASMAQASGSASKLDLAKAAVARSIELIAPSGQVGVIAFDAAAEWIVPLAGNQDRDAAAAAVSRLEPGGGTSILAALQAAAGAIPSGPGGARHVILVTDGGSDPSGIPELARSLREVDGVTLSTVGIGEQAAAFLPALAQIGGGRSHLAASPDSLPRIFAEETAQVQRSYLAEGDFIPQPAGRSSLLEGLDSFPALKGYVRASAKEAAQQVLVSERGEPLLAVWQYGLGKTAAFTSDASPRWAQEWLAWEQFPTFWTQAVNSVTNRSGRLPLEISISENGPSGRVSSALLTVDARREDGGFLDGAAFQARVIDPQGQVQALSLEQVAPGSYQAVFPAQRPGAYLVRIQGDAGQEVLTGIRETAGWVAPYPEEYRLLDAGRDPRPAGLKGEELLAEMAALGGGTVLDPITGPADVFRHDRPAASTRSPLWPGLLTLAALLLPLDVASRRLALTRADLAAVGAALRRRRRVGQPDLPRAAQQAPLAPRLDQVAPPAGHSQALAETAAGRQGAARESAGAQPAASPTTSALLAARRRKSARGEDR